jgi:hypothetical protein
VQFVGCSQPKASPTRNQQTPATAANPLPCLCVSAQQPCNRGLLGSESGHTTANIGVTCMMLQPAQVACVKVADWAEHRSCNNRTSVHIRRTSEGRVHWRQSALPSTPTHKLQWPPTLPVPVPMPPCLIGPRTRTETTDHNLAPGRITGRPQTPPQILQTTN